ncbi:MAG: peptidyl-prolyl cis-trans isomerase [Sedimentisphaerales bacterium]|nr:peptidyl-prolyl cis-trans isomerase [Sedimentisphaerales bacterium]
MVKPYKLIFRVALVTWLTLSFLGGCGGQKPKTGRFTQEEMAKLPDPIRDDLPAPTGGMVLSVGDEVVTIEEVISPFSDSFQQMAQGSDYQTFLLRARPLVSDAVQGKIIDVLLYKRARKKAPQNIDEALEKAVEQEVNRFVAGYGHNYAEAQKAIAQMGFDWQGYRDYLSRLLLVQSYISEEVEYDQPISPGEILDYYNEIKQERFTSEGEIQFRVIDIQPGQLTEEKIGPDETPEQAAARLADALYEKIQGGADFAQVAIDNSHGHRASLGGLWRPLTLGSGSLAKPYDKLETQAAQLEPGQVSKPFPSEDHIFLVKVESKQVAGTTPFSEVQHTLEEELRIMKQRRSYDNFVNKVVNQANIRNADLFIDYCVNEAYQRYARQAAG